MSPQKVETLKYLHRGEIAATETYVQALDKLENDSDTSVLKSIRDDHRDFANELRKYIHEVGDEPDHTSGAWGYWTKFIQGGAQIFGKAVALKALNEGEKHGVNSYETALHEPIPQECKAVIRHTLLPKTKEHVDTLERMMS